MKATICDPDLGIYEVDVPDDDTAALAEIEAFARENTRLILNADRRERYHTPYHLEAMDFEASSLAYHLTPEDILLIKERDLEMARAMESLTPTQRRRLCLWADDGYTHRQIADLEGADYSSVKESINAARKKLRNRF